MSALRILVPVKRVIDYAVRRALDSPLFAVRSMSIDPNGENRSSRESTRPRRAWRRPASSTR